MLALNNLLNKQIELEKKLSSQKFVLSIFNSSKLRVLIDFAALIPDLYDCDKVFFLVFLNQNLF